MYIRAERPACKSLSVYDGMIVAAALISECRTLVSEDLQDGQSFNGSLTVRNPFS